MTLLIAVAVTVALVFWILKGFKAQAALLLAAILLLAAAALLGDVEILPAKTTTGFIWFDIFELLKLTLSSTTAGLGLMIMSVAGFARYMEAIGASQALVKIAVKPLGKLRSPYVVLSSSYVLGQVLALFIPSASGLGILLMLTVYPILIGLGLSRLSGAAAIGTTSSLEIGPASIVSLTSAQYCGMDVITYFTRYQIPVALCVVGTVAVLHYFVQSWFDKHQTDIIEMSGNDMANPDTTASVAPMLYAVLPIIPMALILAFSKLVFVGIRMNVMTAMLISIVVAMLFEYWRHRDGKRVFSDIQIFFDGMGVQFASVVTLIVAGQMFAEGLIKIGAIEAMIHAAQASGLSGSSMIIAMTLVIAIAAIIMGSGNAPFFTFAALAPTVATQMSLNTVQILLPMQFASSIARSISPITAVIVVVSGMAKVSPFDVVKRTAIPMAGALIVNLAAAFLLVR